MQSRRSGMDTPPIRIHPEGRPWSSYLGPGLAGLLLVLASIVACDTSIDSGSSGLVARPAIEMTGTWTGTWEFRTCHTADANDLLPCHDDSDCGGIEGACRKPAAMCNAGENNERACNSDADCLDDTGLPITGACEARDYSGRVDLQITQSEPFLLSPSESGADLRGISIFRGSPCWNSDRWDPNDPDWGNGTFPWEPPIFDGAFEGITLTKSKAFLLKGDPNFPVGMGTERVPDVLLADVPFSAVGNVMRGPLTVPVVPRVIGFETGGLVPKGPYDPVLYAEAVVCENRLGFVTVTRN